MSACIFELFRKKLPLLQAAVKLAYTDLIDGDMGAAKILGHLGNIVIAEADGVAYGDGFTAHKIGIGKLNDIFGIEMAVALRDHHAAGPAVYMLHSSGELGSAKLDLGKIRHGNGFNAAAGQQSKNQSYTKQ